MNWDLFSFDLISISYSLVVFLGVFMSPMTSFAQTDAVEFKMELDICDSNHHQGVFWLRIPAPTRLDHSAMLSIGERDLEKKGLHIIHDRDASTLYLMNNYGQRLIIGHVHIPDHHRCLHYPVIADPGLKIMVNKVFEVCESNSNDPWTQQLLDTLKGTLTYTRKESWNVRISNGLEFTSTFHVHRIYHYVSTCVAGDSSPYTTHLAPQN